MSNELIVYDGQNLKKIYELNENYKGTSLTNIIRECDRYRNIKNLELDNYVIDLTTCFIDATNNRWYSGSIEDYINEIEDSFSDVVFSLNVRNYHEFQEMFPFLFDYDDTVEYVEVKEIKNEKKELIDVFRDEMTLYYYNDELVVRDYIEKFNIIMSSQLVDDFSSINVSFAIDRIEEGKKYIIDVSSLITFIRFRKDQLFMFELLLNKLRMNKNVEYAVNQKHLELLHEMFPFYFSNNINFMDIIGVNLDESDSIINIKSVEDITQEVSDRIQGHGDFFNHFYGELRKYRILNELGQRKIMSIFICGKSGIGKTEFAKSLSEVMYPNEKQIKLNFGNYSTDGVLNSLIGSPLGYVGSEQGGELINKVNDSESKIILIDEFEKANEKVYNFFYELLEDGQFTDRAGNIHDLDGYIIVFTSNLSKSNYNEYIPEPLDSRFDMKYEFMELSDIEKGLFVSKYSEKLKEQLETKTDIELCNLDDETQNNLIMNNNLREIKRGIEDQFIKQICNDN